MKKLFLLAVAGLAMFSVQAQERQNRSIVFTKAQQGGNPKAHPLSSEKTANMVKNISHNHAHLTGVANKTTDGGLYSDWYDLYDQNMGAGSQGYYFDVYSDSNVVADGSNIFWHGMGESFDPTDSGYSFNALITPVNNPLYADTAYVVDSFFVVGSYIRMDPDATAVDSVIVEFVVTQDGAIPPDSGAYGLSFTTPGADFAPITYDSTPRFATAWYNNLLNDAYSKPITTKQRYAIPIAFESYVDTIAGGDFLFQFPLAHPIHVSSSKQILSYVHFKSANTYNLGETNANYMHLYAGEPGGTDVWWRQNASNSTTGYPGSYQDALIAQNQILYSDTGFLFQNHNILIPSYAYAGNPGNPASGFDVPFQAFHIQWPDTSASLVNTDVNTILPLFPLPPLSVNNTAIAKVTSAAYPNPANNSVTVSFTLTDKANATVSLLNIVGQVITTQKLSNVNSGSAVFNTSTLPSGVYMYTLDVNNHRTTGRVVVTH